MSWMPIMYPYLPEEYPLRLEPGLMPPRIISYLRYMKRVLPINTVEGVCKCLFTRIGRLSWENYLGRLEHGGWDTQMTSIMEVYEEESNTDEPR